MDLHPLIIAAPFGNWFEYPDTTRTVGTFTYERRGGVPYRAWRMLRTLRYFPGMHSWRNKLGLPNPGLDAYLLKARQFDRMKDVIISIFGFTRDEWTTMAQRVLYETTCPIEFNLSCPNVAHTVIINDVLRAATFDPTRIIAKLPPIGWMDLAVPLYEAGVRVFHCCNTLWTPAGGLSGAVLRPYTLTALRDIRIALGREGPLQLIGGGGIACADDVQMYFGAGAHHVAIASMLLAPWHWRRLADIHTHAVKWQAYTKPQGGVL